MSLQRSDKKRSRSDAVIGPWEQHTAASYKRELARHRQTEVQLRKALSRYEHLIRQKDSVIHQQDILSQEASHRLLNGMQLIASLLSMQSREANTEVAAQLGVAASRVGTLARLHRHLHHFDGRQSVAFKQYVEDLGREFSAILPPQDGVERSIVVEGDAISLPTSTGIPLGFIANELITNAAKYGKGRITVRLELRPGNVCALSVCNEGAALPQGFDSARCKGLGMKIIRALVGQIGGELRIGPGDKNQGTQFTVLFHDGRK